MNCTEAEAGDSFRPLRCCESIVLNMSAVKITGAIAASFVVAFTCDYIISDQKLFGGTTPGTVSNKEWAEETDKKFQAWPRTAGPPVVMNPISRQNFIVKGSSEE
ncbi:Monopolar spindle 2 [Heracleum sosnowskyi]|uniref:Monopolar spindle 2 n=1 Tax=Heracleum sosnowskyi TaxID=360622 RepID=A0AAD8J4G7_9APIA|nr:Monopolar spindle 2 [Heracleum sosnowskyi]